MALTIFSKTKIEQLADELIETLYSQVSSLDPFVERKIIVPNKNIEKWLKLRIAQNQGVCAGVEFPFFDNFLFKTLAQLADPTEEFTQVSEADIQIKIANLILSDDNDLLRPLKEYIFKDDDNPEIIEIKQTQTARKLWQLSGKLANYIREYEFRRLEYINAFLSENWIENTKAIIRDSNANKESLVLAQAYLCRKLYQEIFPLYGNTLSLRQILLRAAKKPSSNDKKTLYIFGLSTFSPIHAKAIHLLAKHFDIKFYHINVCMEYWGDTESPWEKLKHCRLNEENGQLLFEDNTVVDNELLNAWGSAGRETMKLLVDLEESDSDTQYFYEDEPVLSKNSVLEQLQIGIKTRSSDGIEKLNQDSSIQILACPDQKREIETIYNSILDIIFDGQKNEIDSSGKICSPTPRTDISLSDFAILVPNMTKYRPIIESVFNSRGELPYGLLDSSAAEESHYLRGILEILTIAQFRYTRSSMVSLLSNPCVMKKWGYSDDDLSVWIEYIDRLGIHHHFSHEGLTDDGLIAGNEFTWDYAISRLRLGLITVDESNTNDIPLYTTNNMYREKVEKFSALIETIYHATSPFKTKKLSISNWIETLLAAAENILGANDERMQSNISSTLIKLANGFSNDAEFYSAFILEYLKDKLSNIACNRGSFLTSGITIAALQPMRPIPFKYVFVVGLGEGEFPGSNQESTLDIRAIKRMLGDTSFASRNLYLFLETVMSARERLILSYVASDTKKDIEKYPSAVIKQLERFLDKNILNSAFEEFKVELQEYLPAKQTDDKFKNLNCTYNSFIIVGENLKINKEYKDDFLNIISSKHYLQDKFSRSLYNIKPDFEQLANNQEPLDKNEEIFYWNANVLSDFLKNSRQAILKHRYRVATVTEEIDTTKDTAPKNIKDEDNFVSQEMKRILFDEALTRIKKKKDSPLTNVKAENILKNFYEELTRKSLAPVGIVGQYDKEAQITNLLGEQHKEEKNVPCSQYEIAIKLTDSLTNGEWIKVNIGQQNSNSLTNEPDAMEREINLPPLVYSFSEEKTNTSVILSSSIRNVYKEGNTLYYISDREQETSKKEKENKRALLSNAFFRPLLSLVMYVAAENGNDDDKYSIRINAKDKDTTEVLQFVINLTKKEASDYIYLLVTEILSEEGIKHQYQYQCIYTAIQNALNSALSPSSIYNERTIDTILQIQKETIVNSFVNCEPKNNDEYKFNLSNPPYCEAAIEELYPTDIADEDALFERIINVIKTRYYIPIIRLLVGNDSDVENN